MNTGQRTEYRRALGGFLQSKGETKKEAATIAMVEQSTMGKYINGTRNIPSDIIKRMTNHYDDPMLSVAAAADVGGYGVWLDQADLHPSNVHLKTEEELTEAFEAMRHVPITKRINQLQEQDREQIKANIMECIEAITALTHYVAVLCKEYGFSWMSMWREHRRELKAKEYIS